MKVLILLLSLLYLTACGSSGGSSGDAEPVDYRQTCEEDAAFIGYWEDSALNELQFDNDCYGRTFDSCDLRFGYYKPVNGKMMLQINSTAGGPNCPASGEVLCDFVHDQSDPSDEFLQVNCGLGVIYYFPK